MWVEIKKGERKGECGWNLGGREGSGWNVGVRVECGRGEEANGLTSYIYILV